MSKAGPKDQELVTALRSCASRAAERVGDGCALVFSATSEQQGGGPILRSAAGFPSPDTARAAAKSILSRVEEALRSTAVIDSELPDCERASAGVRILPLAWQGTVHGALAVGAPQTLEARHLSELDELASNLALRLDHMRLTKQLRTPNEATQPGPSGDESPDELLKLSEALFAQDIQLLRNTEKLGKIEKLKNDFIEKMSRELRTPLNSIIEAIIAVIAGENERLSEHSVSSLRNALEEGTAFQRTLQNILDLWRLKQNELPIEIQDVNFAEVVEEAIFSVQETLSSKPVTVEKDFPEALPKFRTDLAKVNQVLFLLLDNAAKFTESGEICIAARLEREQLVCEVRDTGIGICPDDQPLIFDEFFQVDDLGTADYRGAGLGLALARDLTVLLDGEIAVQSEAGKGTTMTFRIPAKPV